jgi:FdhD protein
MIESRPIWKYSGGEPTRVEDDLAVEEPLEIRVRGRSVAVTMRTPAPGTIPGITPGITPGCAPVPPGSSEQRDRQDAELAAGFLLSEGLIRSADDVARIDPCVRSGAGNIVNVFLVPGVKVDFERLSRHVFSSSSCGICGKATLESLQQHFEPVNSDLKVRPDTLTALPARLRAVQACFDRTGGLHAAALFDSAGELLVAREDVGRHNAVDKALGHALLQRMIPLDRHVLLVSGRASFEIVQKALAGGVPIVAAVSAPSSLAVQLAEDSGITLVGFLRDGRMNVYCGEQRITAH